MECNELREASLEIFAHYRDRYEYKLKPGKAHITVNECVGIMASAGLVSKSDFAEILVEVLSRMNR